MLIYLNLLEILNGQFDCGKNDHWETDQQLTGAANDKGK
jgi:hypothetical protein